MEKSKYEKKPWYPNMKELETAMWNKFLLKFPNAYDNVIYNLKLGEGANIPEGTEENLARGFTELTQHKIDVVGFLGNKVDIIELKTYAGTAAVGQVIGYRELYMKFIDPNSNPNLIIVTDFLRPDTKTICDAQGITLIVI
jgi:hypothetical protein